MAQVLGKIADRHQNLEVPSRSRRRNKPNKLLSNKDRHSISSLDPKSRRVGGKVAKRNESPNSQLVRLRRSPRRKMYGSFSQSALDLWNFVRCQRSDGSFYGTSGKCRKGTEAGPKALGKLIGGGQEGKVYGVGRGRVLKIAKDADPNLEAQRIASDAELAPRILAASYEERPETAQAPSY